MKNNYAFPILIVYGVLIVAGLITGSIFLNQTKETFSFNNPLLWIIGGVVLLLLLKRNEPQVIYVGGGRR